GEGGAGKQRKGRAGPDPAGNAAGTGEGRGAGRAEQAPRLLPGRVQRRRQVGGQIRAVPLLASAGRQRAQGGEAAVRDLPRREHAQAVVQLRPQRRAVEQGHPRLRHPGDARGRAGGAAEQGEPTMIAKTEPGGGGWSSVVRDAWGGWDRFWFSRMDPATLSWIRLCCGLLTFYVHLTYSWGLFSYVGKDGFVNHDLAGWVLRDAPLYGTGGGWDGQYVPVGQGNYYWSIYYHVTNPGLIVAIHVFFLLHMLLFALGLATRYTGAITWIGAMSYVQRANSTVFGLDTMMMILLFYLQIG